MANFSDERVRDVLAGKRRYRTILFPGSEVRMALRCLTEAEIDDCRAEAQRQVRQRAKKMALDPETFHDLDPEFFQRLVERQILSRAFHDPDTIEDENPAPFFSSSRDIEQLEATTVKVLFEAYFEHQQWVAPFARMSEEEARAFAENLGKAQMPEALFSGFEQSSLVICAISLASALRSAISPTGRSSSGRTLDVDETPEESSSPSSPAD